MRGASARKHGPSNCIPQSLCPPSRQACYRIKEQDEPQDPENGQISKLAPEACPNLKDLNFLWNFKAHKFLAILALFYMSLYARLPFKNYFNEWRKRKISLDFV